MTLQKSFVFCMALCAVALAFSLIVGPTLPAIVPTHWNASGQIDGRGPKAMILFLMPGVMIFNSLLMLALPKLSPRQFEIGKFEGPYGIVWIVVQAMFLCIHALIVQGGRNEALDVTRWMMPVMFLFFALMGNWMGKIRQNFYMGIRTPWTLADTRVWDATHRAAGKIWFVGGLLGAVITLFGVPIWVSITGFLILGLYPVYLSWAIYRRLSP